MTKNTVVEVEEKSPAFRAGILEGDILLKINGHEIEDVFDYRYFASEENLTVTVLRSGETKEFNIKKRESADLGLVFSSGLMDSAKSCGNRCVFCFIDQLPKGLRETLYFKDDDVRLSFLSGNYVTLTNMSDRDIQKIAFYHLSPINVSVHSTDDNLRREMLRNNRAGGVLDKLKILTDAGITVNFQVVLCKGINDGEALAKTITDLAAFAPMAESLSVVPAGLTKYREENGLYPLMNFTKEEAAGVIKQITAFQRKFIRELDTRFVFAADELYIKAGLSIPDYAEYEEFPQLENGVGMVSLFEREFTDYLDDAELSDFSEKRVVSVVTGTAAAPFLERLTKLLSNRVKNVIINVVAVKNEFFGEDITVSGLLTGRDILNECIRRKESLGEKILIPKNALKAGEPIFLDDMTVAELAERLSVTVIPVEINGEEFIKEILSSCQDQGR
ncbi:Fe-S oxidoreductase [Clostridia bacterium]|nr:Fe-S oxidoreductase [Clostridia bacterium]